jgi:hypothetical protein
MTTTIIAGTMTMTNSAGIATTTMTTAGIAMMMTTVAGTGTMTTITAGIGMMAMMTAAAGVVTMMMIIADTSMIGTSTMRALLLILMLGLPTMAAAQDCDALKRACQMRGELGERGQGNCRKYKDECGGGSTHADYCTQLREACMYKKDNGEEGQGKCKKYRDECR